MKMALNIELDGFEYLSDSDATKLSPKIKQPPISPIESESSSGISSLDSDELKKQSLSSPTISHDDEDQQSDGAVVSTNGSERGDSRDADDEEEDEDENEENDQNDKCNETTTTEDREVEGEKLNEVEHDKKMQKVEVELTVPAPTIKSETYTPVKVMYQNRDILDLVQNIRGSGKLVQFAFLPDNNVKYFFQNRAQYWRLNSGGDEQERQTNDMENCPCCDFTYPSTTHFPKDQTKKPSANAISDSLICFLKTTEQMYASNSNANQSSNNVNANVNYSGSSGLNNFGKRSITNNVSQFAYPMQHQQPNFQQQQSYSLNNNGFNSSSSSNNFGQQQPPMNPFMNNSNSYGTTLALLSMMNNSCNAANAFRAMNNTQRYYNNNQSNMNGGFGLYKQF